MHGHTTTAFMRFTGKKHRLRGPQPKHSAEFAQFIPLWKGTKPLTKEEELREEALLSPTLSNRAATPARPHLPPLFLTAARGCGPAVLSGGEGAVRAIPALGSPRPPAPARASQPHAAARSPGSGGGRRRRSAREPRGSGGARRAQRGDPAGSRVLPARIVTGKTWRGRGAADLAGLPRGSRESAGRSPPPPAAASRARARAARPRDRGGGGTCGGSGSARLRGALRALRMETAPRLCGLLVFSEREEEQTNALHKNEQRNGSGKRSTSFRPGSWWNWCIGHSGKRNGCRTQGQKVQKWQNEAH